MGHLNGKIKRIILCGTLPLVMASAITGCGLIETTDLNEEDEELVAEYAAGVLMRYSADKKGGLGDLRPTPTPIPWVDPADVVPTEAPEEEKEEKEEEVPMEEVEEREGFSDTSSGSAFDGHNLASAIGIDGFDITYEGFETADIYPDGAGDDLSFSMQATPGRKLLVVHLKVANEEGEDKQCDVLSCNVKFRILINETDRVNEQMTILLNDLKSYNEIIPANGSVDTVLVFETGESLTENIKNLSLITVTSNGESVYKLKQEK
ncbi:MAG: hypothetical protein K6G27_02580 [Lachnospiraceae bacterium]|nr:hypothetical protein [Lachnospiraceae bacterium]